MNKFTQDTLTTLGVRIGTLFFGLLLSVLIAWSFGALGKGIYALVILFPVLLAMFANLGIPESLIFYLGKKKHPPSEVFGNTLFLVLCISSVTVLVGFLLIFLFAAQLFHGIDKKFLLSSLLLVPLMIFFNFTTHILIGLRKIKKYNAIRLTQSFTLLFFTFIVLFLFRFGIMAALLAQVFSYLFVGILLYLIVNKESSGVSIKRNTPFFRDSFSYGLKTYLGNMVSLLHYRAPLFLVNVFNGLTTAGFYSLAVELSEGIWLIFQAAVIPLFPHLASEVDQKKIKEFTPRVCRNVLLLTSLVALSIFFLAPFIVQLFYARSFLQSILPLRILLLASVAMSGWRVLANDLYARGKPGFVTSIAGGSALLNIMLSFLWISRWGMQGAALATVFSYGMAFLATLLVYVRISGNKFVSVILPRRTDLTFYKEVFRYPFVTNDLQKK